MSFRAKISSRRRDCSMRPLLVILLLINIWNNANQHVVPDRFGVVK